MTVHEAIDHAYRLQAKWVGLHLGVCYDLNRIHASMLQEHRWNLECPARCTPACARETKGDLILLGKVRKALSGRDSIACEVFEVKSKDGTPTPFDDLPSAAQLSTPDQENEERMR